MRLIVDAATKTIAEDFLEGQALFMLKVVGLCVIFFTFVKRVLFAAVAMCIWLAVTVAVALPGKWTTLDIDIISNSFIFDNHFLYFFILIIADLLISITILDDIELKKRISSRYSVGILFFCMIVTVVVALMKGGGPDAVFLTSHRFGVFIGLMFLFGAIRFIMYWIEDSEGNRETQTNVFRTDADAKTTNVQPKFTAIPVDSIKLSGIT